MPQHVEDLAEQEHGQDPDEGEDDLQQRVQVRVDEVVVLGAEDGVVDVVEDGQQDVAEGEHAREQEDAVEDAALEQPLVQLVRLLVLARRLHLDAAARSGGLSLLAQLLLAVEEVDAAVERVLDSIQELHDALLQRHGGDGGGCWTVLLLVLWTGAILQRHNKYTQLGLH